MNLKAKIVKSQSQLQKLFKSPLFVKSDGNARFQLIKKVNSKYPY